MNDREIKEILEKQQVLLSEYSQMSDADVPSATNAMINLVCYLEPSPSFERVL